jgi:hypothetical protein
VLAQRRTALLWYRPLSAQADARAQLGQVHDMLLQAAAGLLARHGQASVLPCIGNPQNPLSGRSTAYHVLRSC